MASKALTLIAALALALPAAPAGPQWKEQAVEAVHSGQLARAQDILASVADDQKRPHAAEIDSINEIVARIRAEFCLTDAEGKSQILALAPHATDSLIEEWIKLRWIETMTIDGERRWFKRAARNFTLLNSDDFGQRNDSTRTQEYSRLEKYCQEILSKEPDQNGARLWHKASVTFSLDVEADAVPQGEMIRVWLPFPIETQRQRNVTLISASHPATPSRGSVHNTLFLTDTARAGRPTHFEISYSYEVAAQYFNPDSIEARLKPYRTDDPAYQRYTRSEYPNIVIDSTITRLARQIVGTEKSPVRQASMIYDWIVSNLPWASARDYSAIPQIPQYVLQEGHGDCGQVTLLNIALLRSLGIPARWESGWMLHPGAVNLHDWGEVYFEGTGWVPCDVSMGRTTRGRDLADYYKTGTDIYRMAANRGVNGNLFPPKQYLRCDQVDSQLGEVEWRGGNVPASKWNAKLTLNALTPIDKLPQQPWALVKLSVASMRAQPRHAAEMATQAVMGTPLMLLEKEDGWYLAQTPEGYTSYVPANALTLLSDTQMARWRQAERHIVTAYSSRLAQEPGGDETVSDLVLGNILEYQSECGDWVKLATPDGRAGYAPRADVATIEQWAEQDFNPGLIEATARRMTGSPYLWGGTSTKATDCSGLVKICYYANGIILRRDASQQAQNGLRLASDQWRQARRGDLLFFGSKTGRVTHVGIYLADGYYIHCSGQVKINSLDPASDLYLSTPFLSISRIDGQTGTNGVTAAKNHPWYF